MTTPESRAQDAVRLAASAEGARLWRNNVGASLLANGSFVRWGLANDTAAMNAKIKSGDLIGIRPMLILPDHVGTTIGVFVSREVKPRGWKYPVTPSPRVAAQQAWIDLVRSLGGDAAFTTGDWV